MSPFPLSDAKPIEGLELSSEMTSHFGKVFLALALRRVSEGNCGSRAIGEKALAIIWMRDLWWPGQDGQSGSIPTAAVLVESIEFADMWDIGYEKKRSQGWSCSFDVSIWKMGLPLVEPEKAEVVGLGRKIRSSLSYVSPLRCLWDIQGEWLRGKLCFGVQSWGESPGLCLFMIIIVLTFSGI